MNPVLENIGLQIFSSEGTPNEPSTGKYWLEDSFQ
jgi:hypothetical protein